MKKIRIHPDVWVALVILAIMGVLYYLTSNFMYAQSTATFPRMIIVAIIVCDLVVLLKGIRVTVELNRAPQTEGEKNTPTFWQQYKAPTLAFLIFIAYLLIFYFLNFYVATALMLVGMMLFFGVRSWKPLVFVPAGFLLATYLLFELILHVRL